jgi:hypothetical protein
MFTRCANPSCTGWYPSDEGKLFRLDLEIASTAGATQQKIVFLWLCGNCARRMNPRVEVAGNTVRVLLAAALPAPGKPAVMATVN